MPVAECRRLGDLDARQLRSPDQGPQQMRVAPGLFGRNAGSSVRAAAAGAHHLGYTSASMRLSSHEIEYIARRIVKTLLAAEKIEVDSEARVVEGLVRVISDELAVEDRLNEEVREVLAQHTRAMERSDVTYSDMFKKVKRELAKKKGIVL
jgi:hypothetical protein